MNNDLYERATEYIQKMPSLPTSVSKVLEVCANPKLSPVDLNRVISLDPVLVGRVLKLVNSAYYGLDKQETSLVRAIIMLGINTVKNLVLSSAVMASLPSGRYPRGLNMEDFWQHSLCVGVTAKLLAKRRGINLRWAEEYFTSGLLHDLGKIPLNMILSKEYLATVAKAEELGASLFKVEGDTLGIDHCALGAMIVNAWKLEGAVGDAIIYHHRYAEYQGSHKDILYTVALANWFASTLDIGFAGDRYPAKPGYEIWGALGVNQGILSAIVPAVNIEIEKARVFLKL
jgi:HD-like signal output (HDOD) protein